ncbi:MAG TPA: hypothetical protein VGB37_16385 [Candidatus Lokiarchaeia archaeon]
MQRWKNKTINEKVDWCLKWFKITLTIVVIQATMKIIESIVLIGALQ